MLVILQECPGKTDKFTMQKDEFPDMRANLDDSHRPKRFAANGLGGRGMQAPPKSSSKNNTGLNGFDFFEPPPEKTPSEKSDGEEMPELEDTPPRKKEGASNGDTQSTKGDTTSNDQLNGTKKDGLTEKHDDKMDVDEKGGKRKRDDSGNEPALKKLVVPNDERESNQRLKDGSPVDPETNDVDVPDIGANAVIPGVEEMSTQGMRELFGGESENGKMDWGESVSTVDNDVGNYGKWSEHDDSSEADGSVESNDSYQTLADS